MQLIKKVKQYLREHWDKKSPLLLGYSGGPDSKALLYCLVQLKVPLHVAHVDHGWREESASEAEKLRAEVCALGFPFHCVRLEEKPGRNLEEFAREKRLAFFRGLQREIGFQAVVLGHHADDVAETVLKRIFEGAHLVNLGGLSEKCELNGLVVFRPFLQVTKTEIRKFLETQNLTALYDKTNNDPAFLRTRLRHMVPVLTESFGKNIRDNLQVLSSRAFELRQYLEKRVATRWEARVETETTVQLDLHELEPLEARHLIQKALSSQNLSVARTTLELIVSTLPSPPKHFSIRNSSLRLHKHTLTITKPIT